MRLLTGGFVAVLAACSAGVPVDPTPPGLVSVVSLDLSSPNDTVFVTDTVRMVAAARDAQGNILGGRQVSWRSSNPSIATVNPDGLVTSVGPGKADIIAAVTGRTDTVGLVVRRLVFSVNVVPDAVCLRRGFATDVAIEAYDSLGERLPTGLRPVTWESSDGTIGVITPAAGDSARVLGVSEGQVLIVGKLMGLADTTGFIVDPAPLGEPLSCNSGGDPSQNVAVK
ncbi:MAG TPA: Ig-like domain-containing protein [Gemmatimonadales bacterium]|nr:Ig-like domain-containing protein [Gemmatimonadales bacterium]